MKYVLPVGTALILLILASQARADDCASAVTIWDKLTAIGTLGAVFAAVFIAIGIEWWNLSRERVRRLAEGRVLWASFAPAFGEVINQLEQALKVDQSELESFLRRLVPVVTIDVPEQLLEVSKDFYRLPPDVADPVANAYAELVAARRLQARIVAAPPGEVRADVMNGFRLKWSEILKTIVIAIRAAERHGFRTDHIA